MKGLAPSVSAIFEAVSLLDSIKEYTLVGGTALALQIEHRLSEDLDFMTWKLSPQDIREVDWPKIKREIEEKIGEIDHFDIYDLNHVEFMVKNVKLSFYANPNYSPFESSIPFYNNIRLADKKAIGAMKMELLLRRSKYRDYYDIYSLLLNDTNIHEMLALALKYSGHRLKTKNVISLLSNHSRFLKESNFKELEPKYEVTSEEIAQKIMEKFGHK